MYAIRSYYEGSLRFDQLSQVRSLHQFHRIPQHSVTPPDVVDVNDVRMTEAGRQLCLTAEALHGLGVLGQRWGEHFEGDDAFEVKVSHLVNPSVASASDLAKQLVIVSYNFV